MKINWNSKYTTISIYSFFVICASIIFYLIASEINLFQIKVGEAISIFMPFIIGFTMAYLFNFILKFYEENLLHFKIFNNLKPKIKRLIGLVLTYTTVVLVIYSFLKFIFPQVLSSIMGLVNDIPYYVSKITVLVNDFNSKYEIQEEYYNFIVEKWTQYRESIIKFATDLIPILGNTVKNILSSIWNIVLGLIISIYLLTDKEKVMALSKKVTRALFSEVRANRLIELVNRGNNIFGKFLIGKILDSFIIGILTFVVVTMAKMPYTILISFIIGITNIIPFFGPFIGAIPSAIIILFISPVKAFWFLVIVLVIQQIDGNIIGPKILGDSLGISAFWILFSLLITGKLFGLLGMIIGVPLFVFIYSIIKEIVEDRLKKKGLPCETDKYI
ncbi:AI-2E family transporter [Tissierella praeacuta]|uniref:Predicted PurR-regulated permease PerM n=1 Tax=Tissierella praeacuta DSM 18095 TaxID=1123404 RepID=A0A1M4XZF4_9FIRM|nr:AI-2E family transporter [Tissierella praeacuta]HAE91689.1 AI-2E family transporter [Tissierella sp.]MBU5256387.1 AI-2E family transporter [Tissierella praeacuta]TCU69748.1 putative PurR-regulated permease PerM [Tissierella praeacuta]SHE98808.1 Predicted PurR-regulated permease PerM [Tissierella praeacuta DSM 18095]SUP03378.1 pheromone autoinducer 2 transporter [Tissierella praeacuta]